MVKKHIYNKRELVELFKRKRLVNKNYTWYLDSLEVRIFAIYNEPISYIKDINQACRYKIIYATKE